MAGQHLEAIDLTVQKTHEWLGAIDEASRLSKALGSPVNLSSRFQPGAIGERFTARLSTFSPDTRTSSSHASVSARQHHAVLVAGHVLEKLAVAAIPVVIVALGVATMAAFVAAFVGGYLAALG